jgi:hypothetical protein
MRSFFSSDAFELYRKDILSALSLPMGYTQHFRYPTHQVSSQFPRNLSHLRGAEGVIVYVTGNDLSLPKADRKVKFLPIRKVRVIKATFSNNTGLLHFHLELLEFVSGQVVRKNINPLSLPPYEFICDVELSNSKAVTWQQKIRELVDFDRVFEKHLFCNLEFIRKNNFLERISGRANNFFSTIEPRFDELEAESYIELKEDRQYRLKVSTYNTAQPKEFEDYALSIGLESDDLEISAPDKIVIGGQRDDRTYTIATKILKSLLSPTFVKFQSMRLSKAKDDKDIELYELVIRFVIRKPRGKIVMFGFLTSITLITSFLVVYAVSTLKSVESQGIPWLVISTALALSVISSTCLYYFFNKQ